MEKIQNKRYTKERSLIVLTGIVALNGLLVVSLSNSKLEGKLVVFLSGLVIFWLLAHYILRRKVAGDELLLPLALLLSAVGFFMIYRLKPDLVYMQLLWNGIGIAAFLATVIYFHWWERLTDYKYFIGILGIGLLLSAIIFGVEIGGNKNWIVFGSIRFQPSEFGKIFIIFFLAVYLAERRELLTHSVRRFGPIVLPSMRFAAPLLVFWGLTMLMLVFQRDLGSALLYFGTALAMIYVASGRLSYALHGLLLFLSGATVCYYLYPHVQVRVDIWINPWSDPNGKSYQIAQSLFALGSGGVLGSGLTYGFPNLIPEVHTDFVFAAIGEELGFLGSAAILFAYMLFLIRSFSIALKGGNPFRQLMAGGLSIFFGLQVLLIVGGVTKFLPLTGVTLPFISYGGSSMVSNYILLGILVAVSGAGERFG